MISRENADPLTFLFTDIEGSSRLWEEQPGRMRQALARHDVILRSAIERNRGTVVKTTGDGVHAAFGNPHDAVAAAVEFQRVLANPGSTGGLALGVRCGVHAGVVESRDGDFFGSAVNRTARIMDAAHGGQVLVSQAAADLTSDRLPDGVSLRDLGAVRLRDLFGTERVYQVAHADLREDFPALRSLEVTPNNLPQPSTSFVGRERELADVTRLLANHAAADAARRRRHRQDAPVAAGGGRSCSTTIADGVWFVELAPLTDATARPAGRGVGAGRQGGGGASAGRGAGQIRARPAAAADPRQLRASGGGVRGAGRPAAAGRSAS